MFARSATAGGQQFPVHWGGDCTGTFESMAESLRGGLSLTLSGFSYWSHDIGGFEEAANPTVYKDGCSLEFYLLTADCMVPRVTGFRGRSMKRQLRCVGSLQN